MKSACIILPTYNEAENIREVLTQIFLTTKTITNWNVQVLVVDDNSPDGTADIVRTLQQKNTRIHLLQGTKQGLGVAYVRGMTHAMKEFNPDVVFEMDADLSHPPTLLTLFLETIDKGNDFVIGSRYIKGGATPDWDWKRKLISGGGNFFARIVAGIYSVHDCTSGYRAIKTSLLKKLDLKNLGAKGYSFQLNLLYEAYQKKANIAEIPLIFPDRKLGQSKMKLKDITEFFFNSFKLRLKTWDRFIKFCLVGGSGYIINMTIIYALTELAHIDYRISGAIAIQTAIIWNFILNDKWTFKKSTNESSWFTKFIKFQGVSLVGAGINWISLYTLTEFGSIYYLLSHTIGIAIATFWNYFINTYYTWRDKR